VCVCVCVCGVHSGHTATSAILMRMMKMGGGQQLARSRYLLRESFGSIHLETDRWNFSQHPIFLTPSGWSASLPSRRPSRSTGSGSCCSRSMASITAPALRRRLNRKVVGKWHFPNEPRRRVNTSLVQLQQKHQNLHEGRTYCKARFSSGYLINQRINILRCKMTFTVIEDVLSILPTCILKVPRSQLVWINTNLYLQYFGHTNRHNW